jgi:hypothetical protein
MCIKDYESNLDTLYNPLLIIYTPLNETAGSSPTGCFTFIFFPFCEVFIDLNPPPINM